MPIYDIFDAEKDKTPSSPPFSPKEESIDAKKVYSSKRDRFFSSLGARVFFFLLLMGDLCWLCYALVLFTVGVLTRLCTFSKVSFFNTMFASAYLSVKRALVCGFSLFISLFSPAFGIMIACTYFLMYDKKGIDEVVPSSLQEQFKEFFPPT